MNLPKGFKGHKERKAESLKSIKFLKMYKVMYHRVSCAILYIEYQAGASSFFSKLALTRVCSWYIMLSTHFSSEYKNGTTEHIKITLHMYTLQGNLGKIQDNMQARISQLKEKLNKKIEIKWTDIALKSLTLNRVSETHKPHTYVSSKPKFCLFSKEYKS